MEVRMIRIMDLVKELGGRHQLLLLQVPLILMRTEPWAMALNSNRRGRLSECFYSRPYSMWMMGIYWKLRSRVLRMMSSLIRCSRQCMIGESSHRLSVDTSSKRNAFRISLATSSAKALQS